MSNALDNALAQLNSIILGKEQQIKLSVCCLLGQGHLLIEDLPGVGKTTMALALAKTFGLDFQRIQFTSDILPADLLGVSIFDRDKQSFKFHHGPIFSQCVLADEVNRTTPKSQSALLEAMEEKQISIDGETYQLPKPFFVIGTQNPIEQSGTYPLPESQLDRFMMKIKMGYPNAASELQLYKGKNSRDTIKNCQEILHDNDIVRLQKTVDQVHVSDDLLQYIHHLITATRDANLFSYGLSPRAGLSIVKAAKSWALMHQQDFVQPEHVKAIFSAVSAHRLMPHDTSSQTSEQLIEQIIQSTPIP